MEYLTHDFFKGCKLRKIEDITKLHKEDKRAGEVFVSIKKRTEDNKYLRSNEYYYMTANDNIRNIDNNMLYTGLSGIEFIQWENVWNVVFEERSIIGSVNRRMSFDEFSALFPDVELNLTKELVKKAEGEPSYIKKSDIYNLFDELPPFTKDFTKDELIKEFKSFVDKANELPRVYSVDCNEFCYKENDLADCFDSILLDIEIAIKSIDLQNVIEFNLNKLYRNRV